MEKRSEQKIQVEDENENVNEENDQNDDDRDCDDDDEKKKKRTFRKYIKYENRRRGRLLFVISQKHQDLK